MIIILFNSLMSSGESSSDVLDEIMDGIIDKGYEDYLLAGAASLVRFANGSTTDGIYRNVVGRLSVSTMMSSSYGSFQYREFENGKVEIIFRSDSVVSSNEQYSTAYIFSPGIGDLYIGMCDSDYTSGDVNNVKRYSSDVIGVSFTNSGYTDVGLGIFTDSSLSEYVKLEGKFIAVFVVKKNSVLV